MAWVSEGVGWGGGGGGDEILLTYGELSFPKDSWSKSYPRAWRPRNQIKLLGNNAIMQCHAAVYYRDFISKFAVFPSSPSPGLTMNVYYLFYFY